MDAAISRRIAALEARVAAAERNGHDVAKPPDLN
jgi:hypothetical protein